MSESLEDYCCPIFTGPRSNIESRTPSGRPSNVYRRFSRRVSSILPLSIFSHPYTLVFTEGQKVRNLATIFWPRSTKQTTLDFEPPSFRNGVRHLKSKINLLAGFAQICYRVWPCIKSENVISQERVGLGWPTSNFVNIIPISQCGAQHVACSLSLGRILKSQ